MNKGERELTSEKTKKIMESLKLKDNILVITTKVNAKINPQVEGKEDLEFVQQINELKFNKTVNCETSRILQEKDTQVKLGKLADYFSIKTSSPIKKYEKSLIENFGYNVQEDNYLEIPNWKDGKLEEVKFPIVKKEWGNTPEEVFNYLQNQL